jgi:hypothetical protein
MQLAPQVPVLITPTIQFSVHASPVVITDRQLLMVILMVFVVFLFAAVVIYSASS